jgi:hypothetical protein
MSTVGIGAAAGWEPSAATVDGVTFAAGALTGVADGGADGAAVAPEPLFAGWSFGKILLRIEEKMLI